MLATGTFLRSLTESLTTGLFPDYLVHRLKTVADNELGGPVLELQQRYERDIRHLVGEISRVISVPDQALSRLQTGTYLIQYAIWDRCGYARDVFGDNPDALYTVPTDIRDLFRWIVYDLFQMNS